MKHNLRIVIILTLFFFLAQVVGLVVINKYIDHKASEEKGEVVAVNLPYNMERPPIEKQSSFLLFIVTAILIGTILLLILIKFRKTLFWKIWYFAAVCICLAIAFSAFINSSMAFILAVVLTFFKVFRPSLIVHNLTEIFVYGGLAAIFVLIPVVNVFVAFAMLLLISVYDMYAVWKSKHMIALAKFTNESKVFAGLSVPYRMENKEKAKSRGVLVRGGRKIAILGGGDIGFTLMFAGAVMKDLMLQNIIWLGFLKALIVPLFTTIALLLLFVKGKKDKFYPAMPFLSIGCLAGYLALALLNLVV